MKIRIGAITYTVQTVKKGAMQNSEDSAEINYNRQQITIREELKEDLKSLCLMHESIHAILSHMCEHKLNDNEAFVDRIAHAILMFLVDNEDLVKEMIKNCGKDSK